MTERLLHRIRHRRRLKTKLNLATAIRTSTTFAASLGDPFPTEAARKRAMAKARAHGVNPEGKRFIPGLCRHGVRDDPDNPGDSGGS